MQTLVIATLLALLGPAGGRVPFRAQTDTTIVSGTLAPAGPPLAGPTRVDAGGGCVVDLAQSYEVAGALQGSMEVDYRILVHGPCGSAPGDFDEEWIARGEFTGTLGGAEITSRLTYTATVRDGAVDGDMVFGPGVAGELTVSGRFDQGRLGYSGWVSRAP